MPPKAKLHKDKGKLKSIPKVSDSNTENNEPGPSTSQPDTQNFEVELCWCIQQLQTALKVGKLNQKQMQDNTKTLNVLMSNSAPVIKKRQLMRLSFGDYRAKMAQEEKKISKINQQIKLVPAKPSKKSVFIKKAPFLASDTNYKFDFKEPKPETSTNSQQSTENKENSDATNKEFHYEASDNTFRFNFSSKE